MNVTHLVIHHHSKDGSPDIHHIEWKGPAGEHPSPEQILNQCELDFDQGDTLELEVLTSVTQVHDFKYAVG